MPNRAEIIATQLARHLRPGLCVLEIGAGKGQVAKALQAMSGVHMSLVDVVDYNQTDLPLMVYDGVHLPFPDRSFDYSLLVFVLHHTPDPHILLREAQRVSSAGVFVVENHVPGRVRSWVTQAVDSIPHWQHGVPVCYRAQTIDVWQQLFLEFSPRPELVSRFVIDRFWDNFITLLPK